MAASIPFFPSKTYCVLIGNGECPSPDKHTHILNNARCIICADGGANYAYRQNVKPDWILGDLDSIEPEVLEYYQRQYIPIQKLKSQRNNDLEKALRKAIRLGYQQLILIGFIGKRIDQTLATLQVAKKYVRKARIILYSSSYEIYPLVPGKYTFAAQPGDPVSIFGFPRAYGITTTGLQWSLTNNHLLEGSRGLSNLATNNFIKISFARGFLLLLIAPLGSEKARLNKE
jgi:thiamine pyrophosphokinase